MGTSTSEHELEIFPVTKVWDAGKGKWTKTPAVRGSWKGYRATEEERARYGNLGLGIPKGRVVIDVDCYKGTTTAMIDSALGVALDWKGAALQRTVSGGEHYCFRLPPGVEIRQGDSLLGVVGFDTRCTGKGWICSGEGYKDLTTFGLPESLWFEGFPELPEAAIRMLQGDVVSTSSSDAGADIFDLEIALSSRPLDDISVDDVREYLSRLGDEHLTNYGNWLKVGLSLHHQFGGSREGLLEWAEWSKQCDDRELCNADGVRVGFDRAEIDRKWSSFGRRANTKPTRFDYVIKMAGGRIRKMAPLGDRTLLGELISEAEAVANLADWQNLKERVGRLTLQQLPSDHRAMICKALEGGWLRDAGLGKGEIRAALKAGKVRKGVAVEVGNPQRPAWLTSWAYVESACQFYNTRLHYGIRREAFNAKYDRESECLAAEKRASDYALVDMTIPTVVDAFFWPNAAAMFEHEGRAVVNTYRDCRVAPLDEWDEEGRETVRVFEEHLVLLFGDERERRLVVDWMAYVVRNPGRRVNWALVIQGAQGIGKSYLSTALQAVMGDGVKNLDATAISGRFTAWAHGAIVNCVEELRVFGTNRWEVLDRLKPFVTNSTIQIEEKGRDHRTVPNFTSYLFLSNYKDALPIVEDDRRYCVLFADIQSEAELFNRLGGELETAKYFERLFSLTEKRPDALRRYFEDWEYSDEFAPRGRAPSTRAKETLKGLSVAEDQMTLEDAISRHECEVVGPQLLDVTWLNKLCVAEGLELPKARTIGSILLRMGYTPVTARRVWIKASSAYHYIWIKAPYNDDYATDRVQAFHEGDGDVPF